MSTIKVDTVRPVTSDASLTLQGDNSGTGVSGITIDSSGNAALGGVLKLKSSGNSITASNGTTAVLSESGGLVTLADTVQHVVPIVVATRGTSDQSPISSSTFTKVQYNAVVTDTHSFFDATTNYRFLPTIAGYYQINANVGLDTGVGTGTRWIISVYKNGSNIHRVLDVKPTSSSFKSGGSCLVEFNGSTDYVEIYSYVTSGSTISFKYAENETFFNAFLVQRT